MFDAALDQELLARIRAGDKLACAECIEHHAPGIYRLALRLMSNESDAEDVVQETFLNAFRAIGSFEGRSTLKTWLYRIAYNAAMTRLRRKRAKMVSVDDMFEQVEEGKSLPQQLFNWCCLPEQEIQSSEVRAELEQAISNLSPKLKAVFVMREVEGLSTKECAEALNVSPSVVKTRLHRARLRLREQLSAYFVESR